MRAPWTGTRRARLETGCSERLGLAVEGVEPENVAVAPVPRRRAGAAVAGASEVVLPFARRDLALAQLARAWIESPRDPVREDAARGIRVVGDQRQRPCLARDVRPPKRRRDILAVAGVPARDRLCVLEGAALDGELGHQQVRWSAAAVRRGSSSP